jgi:hypothetical protein
MAECKLLADSRLLTDSRLLCAYSRVAAALEDGDISGLHKARLIIEEMFDQVTAMKEIKTGMTMKMYIVPS